MRDRSTPPPTPMVPPRNKPSVLDESNIAPPRLDQVSDACEVEAEAEAEAEAEPEPEPEASAESEADAKVRMLAEELKAAHARALEDRELIHTSQAGYKAHVELLEDRVEALEAELAAERQDRKAADAAKAVNVKRIADLQAELGKAKRNQAKLVAALDKTRSKLAAALADADSQRSALTQQLDAAHGKLANTELLLQARDRQLVQSRAAFNLRVGELEDLAHHATARLRSSQALTDPAAYIPRHAHDALRAKLDKARAEIRDLKRALARAHHPPVAAIDFVASGTPSYLSHPATSHDDDTSVDHSRSLHQRRPPSASPEHPKLFKVTANLTSYETDRQAYA
ncbi:uncharacterized protein AMSG_02243 [Thecamonas trahens ATCC 50062]|uniref:Uncharacterized protein n=1 Tax=Thecamonas trahens ATCC 50062 TaxID=461836 RepID=A0A0L0DVD9_THETB|nr:hypothetical protein AMSG_02243 [Thecamonas trahens ATCC 50062]KNC56274.1 hypothetical protein AMSG_02243 [Thecamonas trahens ATCC 50062]|eukprot:XP_013760793.1 hypothetical protein AMSG_02243 [Thecamonas trahens ATCC 50062]